MAAEQIRLLVIEDVPQVAAHMRQLLQAQSQIKMLDVVTAGERAVSAVSEFKPDVVIVDALLQGRVSGGDVALGVRQAEPQVGVVMLTVPQNPVVESAERGVDSVLKMPFSGFDLTTIVRKTHELRSAQSTREGSMMISLFSPKGGVGRTTIAYNLAVALSADHRVCLVDGSLQFSDLRGLLRVPATAPSIVNLPTDRIREADVADVAWKDPSGVDILLAPPRVEMAEMVTVRDLEKSLSILRQLYQFVVIDTRAGLGDDVLVFLDASDLILQVLTYDSMAIRNLAMAGEAFDAIGYPRHQAGHRPEPIRLDRRHQQGRRRDCPGQPHRLRDRVRRSPGGGGQQRGRAVRLQQPRCAHLAGHQAPRRLARLAPARARPGSRVPLTPSVTRSTDSRPIGVFDSGVGGLTVLSEIRRRLPDESDRVPG